MYNLKVSSLHIVQFIATPVLIDNYVVTGL